MRNGIKTSFDQWDHVCKDIPAILWSQLWIPEVAEDICCRIVYRRIAKDEQIKRDILGYRP